MMQIFLMMIIILFSGGKAMCSAPAALEGPDTYTKFTAEVTSVEKINYALPNSDVSHDVPKDFWTVKMKILSAKTFIVNSSSDLTPTNISKDHREKATKPKLKKGQEVNYFFDVQEKINKGDIIEGVTRTDYEISIRWYSPFLSSYKIKPPK